MKLVVQPTFAAFSKVDKKSQERGKRVSIITPALPETAASVAIAAAVVGAAATLLVQRNKASKTTELPMKTCEDCGGSAICSQCKGEGFVVRNSRMKVQRGQELQLKTWPLEIQRRFQRNGATVQKCSSARSCSACGGSGKISY